MAAHGKSETTMPKKIVLLIVVVASSLAGCSPWLEARRQTISITTYANAQPMNSQQTAGLDCRLVNDRGQWQVTSPSTVEIITSSQDLVVTCTQVDGTSGTVSAIARPTPGYLLHKTAAVLVPVGVPSSIDQLTRGAPMVYPSNIHVVMNEEVLVTSDE